jgi:hypothetical protein
MSPQTISLILFSILAALYLPALFVLLRRWEGQENTALLLTGYMVLALVLTLLEGLRYGGRLQMEPQTALDTQLYGALFLAILMTLTVTFFVRRDLWTWLCSGSWRQGRSVSISSGWVTWCGRTARSR